MAKPALKYYRVNSRTSKFFGQTGVLQKEIEKERSNSFATDPYLVLKFKCGSTATIKKTNCVLMINAVDKHL